MSSIWDDIDEILLTEEQIQRRVRELGEELSNDYARYGNDVILLCILKGASVFFTDLARAMPLPLQMEFMGISSYGDKKESSGVVRVTKDIDIPITGKHVLIAEDIMDSGLTFTRLTQLLLSRKPASMRICCLLDKPLRRTYGTTPDYCGFVIPDKFVVGYGLDYAGYYRNLPFVGVLKPSVYEQGGVLNG